MFLFRERKNLDALVKERQFQVDLMFRRMKCCALKVFALTDPERHMKFVERLSKLQASRSDTLLRLRDDLTTGYLFEAPEYDPVIEKKRPFNQHQGIKVLPDADKLDFLFEDVESNPYRKNDYTLPTTTPQQEVDSAQLRKYKLREMDRTPAERLGEYMNQVLCARAMMRVVFNRPDLSQELSLL